jgi:hypothetical protein
MDINQAIETAKKRFTIAQWVIGIGGGLLVAMFAWIAVVAALGAAAVGTAFAIAATVGLAIVNATPVVIKKASNMRIEALMREQNRHLAAIQAEAERNPIPTLWNQHAEDGKEIQEMKDALMEYAAEIGNVQAKAKKLSSALRPEDLEAFNQDIAMMQADLELQEQEYAETVAAHKAAEVEIQRASAIWDLQMAVENANAKNANRVQDTLSKIKRDTALDAVTAKLNTSKAKLRARIRERAPAGQVIHHLSAPSQTPLTFDVNTTTKEKVR